MEEPVDPQAPTGKQRLTWFVGIAAGLATLAVLVAWLRHRRQRTPESAVAQPGAAGQLPPLQGLTEVEARARRRPGQDNSLSFKPVRSEIQVWRENTLTVFNLGMVGYKTVLESIRATIQSRQRKKLFLQGRPVYPLASHYCQTWQHLPDYGAYHATLIADPALPGKWQPGEEVVYLLVFEGELMNDPTQVNHAKGMLASRLSETLPIPILDDWNESLWEAGQRENLIVGLLTGGDSQEGYLVQSTVTVWKEVVTRLLKEQKIRIASD